MSRITQLKASSARLINGETAQVEVNQSKKKREFICFLLLLLLFFSFRYPIIAVIFISYINLFLFNAKFIFLFELEIYDCEIKTDQEEAVSSFNALEWSRLRPVVIWMTNGQSSVPSRMMGRLVNCPVLMLDQWSVVNSSDS